MDNMKIYGLSRFYEQIFLNTLHNISKKNNLKIEDIKFCTNKLRTVYYWSFFVKNT